MTSNANAMQHAPTASSSRAALRAAPPGASFAPCAVLPTYNNDNTLANILDRVADTGLPIVLVNDGSTDRTALCIEEWIAANPQKSLHLRVHSLNKGKAAALQTAFASAREIGFTHGVTIDTDGQLDPEEIPQMLAVAEADPAAFVLGARDDRKGDYPFKSKLGRRLSNAAIWLECGKRVSDSQCGFRVYPLAMLDRVVCRTGRFNFEAEIITRAAWAGVPLINVHVFCRYFHGRDRVTHFKPGSDSLRGIGLHLRLLARRLAPVRNHRNKHP